MSVQFEKKIFFCLLYNIVLSGSDVSLFPIFLIDKVPLRFFYHFFLVDDKKDELQKENLFNITASYRRKNMINKDIVMSSQYYVLNEENMQREKHDVTMKYSFDGGSDIYVLGSDFFLKNSLYYLSIDMPITCRHEKVHIKSVKYDVIDSFLKDSFFSHADIFSHNQNDISNIDIMFGVDQWKGHSYELGYYFLLTTPNIIGPAIAFEYKFMKDDFKQLNIHLESLFQFIPGQESVKTYQLGSYSYDFTHTYGTIFYTESIINLNYQWYNSTLSIGYSFITQDGKRSAYLIFEKNKRIDQSSYNLPQDQSSQWLSIVYGGYSYSKNDFNLTVAASYNGTVVGHYTPPFYDFIFTIGYEF